ncbi:phosphatase PAP2 family protein [Pandoraea terrigena]|uniref:PAP2 family protein n=1 Tax=Pandoraea terrigena TaxID=2508292 RepID=A0A5E4URJ6_9BURK|nr:phosphatase PAP2 family protein [Pandoraea terrigena]VVE02153.1 PAP2 family protein [Pandoraea terrigena]
MNWLRINACVTLAAVIGLTLLQIGIAPGSLVLPALACVTLAGVWIVYTHYRPDERIRTACSQVIVLIVFSHVAALLSYVVVATDAPLVDVSLVKMDAWLHFDWPTWHAFVRAHRLLSLAFALAYASGMVQIAFVVVFLSLTGRLVEVRVFSTAMVLSCLVTIAVSGFVPAAGAFAHFGGDPAKLADLTHFDALRQHRLLVVDLGQLQGLISMPSYHAVLSVLLIHAARGSRRLARVFVPLNLLVIVSAISEGGHYLVDILAGIGVAVLAIFVARPLLGVVPEKMIPAQSVHAGSGGSLPPIAPSEPGAHHAQIHG